jgi:WD40 repeat protein
MARVTVMLLAAAVFCGSYGLTAPASGPASARLPEGLLKPTPPGASASAPASAASFDPARLQLAAMLGSSSFRHGGTVTGMIVLADNRRLLSAGNDNTARLWDLETGNLIRRFQHSGSRDYVWDILLLGQDKFVSASSESGPVLWDINTGKRLGEFPQGGMSFRLALDAGARRLAVTDEKQAVVWDVQTRKSQATLLGHNGPVYTVFFDDQGNVVSGGGDTTIRRWFPGSTQPAVYLKPKDKKTRDSGIPPGGSGGITTLVPSPDRSRAFVCCATQPWVMDCRTGQKLYAASMPAALTAAWSHDGQSIAAVTQERPYELYLADAQSGQVRWKAPLSSESYGVAISPDGSFVCCSDGGLIRRFSAADGKQIYPPVGQPLQNRQAKVLPAPGGKTVLEWGSENGIRFRDAATGAITATCLGEIDVDDLAVSADGKTLVARREKSCTVIDVASGRSLRSFEGGNRWGSNGALALNHDGSRAFMASYSGVEVRSTANGELIEALNGGSGEGPAPNVAITLPGVDGLTSAPGDLLAAYSEKHVALFSADGRSLQTIQPQTNEKERLRGCRFLGLTRGMLIATDKRLMLWDLDLPEKTALTPQQVRQAVEQLGADAFADRQAASGRLLSGGAEILPLLRQVQSSDPEVKTRLAEIQEKLAGLGEYRLRDTLDTQTELTVAVHPDGVHWAARRQDDARMLVFGRVENGKISLSGQHEMEDEISDLAFDDAGRLLVGMSNGAVGIYVCGAGGGFALAPAVFSKPPATSQPAEEGQSSDQEGSAEDGKSATKPAAASQPASGPAGEVFPDWNQKEQDGDASGPQTMPQGIPGGARPGLGEVLRRIFD